MSTSKSSIPPHRIVSEIVLLDKIVGPYWATGESVVAGMRASHHAGRSLGALGLRHLPGDTYEIIDCQHRLVALRAEDVKDYRADVVECSDDEADEWRIAASLQKEQPVLHARALQAIRERFNRDLGKQLEGVQVVASKFDGKRVTLPPDPAVAIEYVISQKTMGAVDADEEIAAVWQAVEDWLDRMGKTWGRDRDWLVNEVLGLGMLLGDVPQKDNAVESLRLIRGIPDMGLRQSIAAKLKYEKPGFKNTKLKDALNWLGVGPDSDKPDHVWLPKHTPEARASYVVRHSLSEIADRYWKDAKAYLETRDQEREKTEKTGREAARDEENGMSPLTLLPAPVAQPEQPRPFAQSTLPPRVDRYEPVHNVTTQLLRAWVSFDQEDGAWQRQDVQEDLDNLIKWATVYRNKRSRRKGA